jgi:polygalacturonase
MKSITLTTYRHEAKTTLESPAIQAALDACAAAGGGRVTLTAGTYRCGSLYLRDSVSLHLEAGAVIVGSARLSDYPPPASGFTDAIGDVRGRALIAAERVRDVAITGEGVIDGNGGAFPIGSPEHKVRPFLCRVAHSRNIRVEGVILRAAAAWTLHVMGCEDVTIRGIRIDSRINENNDGIDIDSSRRVTISDCDIASDDDAICLKATLPEPCEDVEVSGCTLVTECSALKLGTESYGDIRRISMHDCRIRYAATGAIKLLTSDGGIFEDIEIRDILIERGTGPIFLRLGARARTYVPGVAPKPAGKLRRVRFANIQATTFVPPKEIVQPFTGEMKPARAFSGIFITGLPGHPVEDVSLENVDISFCGGGQPGDIGRILPEEPAMYPELFYFGALPAACAYVRHARAITFRRVVGRVMSADVRPPFVSEDVEDCRHEDCTWPGNDGRDINFR